MRALTSLLFIICVSTSSLAQDPELKNIATSLSIEDLKTHLYNLASDKMQGRDMGSHGDTLASEYVIDFLKKNNIRAPYDNGKSYYQSILVDRKVISNSELIISGNKYNYLEGWSFSLRNTEASQFENIPVVFAGYGIENAKYNDFSNIDVKGKAVLLFQGQPRDSTGNYLLSGSRTAARVEPYLDLLKQKGAAFVMVYTDRFTQDSIATRRAYQGVYKNRYGIIANRLPQINLSEARANEILSSSNSTVEKLKQEITRTGMPQSFALNNPVTLHIDIKLKEEKAPNVIGVLPGTDPSAGYIIVSAHHDHVGTNGKVVYYGAVDNASGTVALMEIAAMMNQAAQQGKKPKRSIVFASFTGEEKGELGSYYFAANPFYPLDKTYAVLNIDMMGRVDTFYSGRRADSSYAYILVKDSLNRGLRSALLNANEKLGKLKLDTYYEQPQFMQRRLTGSDHYPFYLKGVPFVRIDCGFSKDYHQPTDTPDKINYQLLSDQIQLAFLTTWNLANQ